MYLRLLEVEARKLLKHPLLWLQMAGLVGILAMYFILRYALVVTSAGRGVLAEPRSLALDLQDGMELFSFVSILFYAGAAALITSYDFPERGIQAWLMRGVPRPLLVLARLGIVLVVGLALVALAVFATLGVSALAHLIFLGSFANGHLDWARLLPAILRLSWGAVPYLALTVLLAIASRSPLFAAGGAVVFRTALESGLLHLAEQYPALARLSPAQLALALQAGTYPLDRAARAAAASTPVLGETQAALVIGAILLVCAALSALLFSRQDWGG